MEQNKVEILEALNNEKMYSLRGDEVGEMCSPEGNDTYRNSGTFIAEIGGFTALFGEVQSVCHPFATRKNKKDVMKEERVNMLNNQHVRPYNML